ncbi:MAG: hypothetical protein AAF789_09060 [Bacteroidota bacterium]
MLFKKRFLTLIEEGKIDLAFRKWIKPSVSVSGTLLTPVGQLRITSLEKIRYNSITAEDISQAGYEDRNELDKEFSLKEDGEIYRIGFVLERADPRSKLREKTSISGTEITGILDQLRRLDTRGKVKNWTCKVLELADQEPGKHAIEYACKLGVEKEWFKLNVRKLKNLGLTISKPQGYEISPRGKVILKELRKKPNI